MPIITNEPIVRPWKITDDPRNSGYAMISDGNGQPITSHLTVRHLLDVLLHWFNYPPTPESPLESLAAKLRPERQRLSMEIYSDGSGHITIEESLGDFNCRGVYEALFNRDDKFSAAIEEISAKLDELNKPKEPEWTHDTNACGDLWKLGIRYYIRIKADGMFSVVASSLTLPAIDCNNFPTLAEAKVWCERQQVEENKQ